MPIGLGNFGGKSAGLRSEESQLTDDYIRLRDRFDLPEHERLARQSEGAIYSGIASAGRGIQEGLKSAVNLPGNLVGLPNLVDGSLIAPREGFVNQSITAAAQFLTILPAGGPVASGIVKGAQLLRAGGKVKKLAETGFKKRLTTAQQYKQAALDGTLKFGVVDFVAFDGTESLLMNMLDSHPELKDSYATVTLRPDWNDMSAAELAEISMREGGFSAERLSKSWTGRGANMIEGAVIGSILQVFWRAAKLKLTNDKMTVGVIEGRDAKIAAGVTKTEKDGIQVVKKSAKELQEETAFTPKATDATEAATPEQLRTLREQERELAEAQADLAEKTGNMKDDIPHSAVKEEDAAAPAEWDAMDQQGAYGKLEEAIPDSAWEPGRVAHREGYKPVVEYVNVDGAAGDIPLISSTVNGVDDAVIHINRPALAEVWVKEGADIDIGRKYTKDAFNTYDDFEAFTIARESARIRFSKLAKESAAGYQNRLDRAAANTMKRKGLGNFWKYEMDAVKGMEQFKMDEDVLMGKLFSDPEKMKTLLKGLSDARKGQGADLNKMFLKAQELINLDATMSHTGQKYFSARLMHFMMTSMRRGLSKSNSVDPITDQLAKALQWSADHESRLTASDFVTHNVLNSIDEIATANGLSHQGVAERLRKGYGDFKHLFPELKTPSKSLDAALAEDVSVMQEMYIRTWAYRLDQMVSMKGVSDLANQLTDVTAKEGMDASTRATLQAQFAASIERLEPKLAAFRNLSRAQGRAMAANKSMADVGLGGEKAIYDEIVNKAGGAAGLENLASKINAITTANKSNPATGASVAKGLVHQAVTGIDIHNEYWLNAILSGTKTQVVNTLGTVMHMAYKPLEGALGAVGGTSQQKQYFVSQGVFAANMLFETMKVLGALGLNKGSKVLKLIDDAAYMKKRGQIFAEGGEGAAVAAGARKSLRTGKATLESRSELFDVTPPKAIGKESISEASSKWAKSAMEYLGNVIRVPSRFMITTDELFKQVQFRSAAMARLTAEAMEELPAKSQTTEAIRDYVATRFQGLVRSTGARYSPDIIKDEAYKSYFQAVARAESTGTPLPDKFQNKKAYIDSHTVDSDKSELSTKAMEWAEDTTYTRSLDDDLKMLQSKGHLVGKTSMHKDVQDFVGRHGWFRVILPFIRTPINLLKFPLQRIPFGAKGRLSAENGFLKKIHMKYQADILSGDTIKAAEAAGRLRAGWFMYGGFISLAYAGNLTGSGPQDPVQRRQLMATGWRPYSFKIPGEGYISYARLDPFSSILGLAADSFEFFDEASKEGDVDTNWIEQMALAGAFALSQNIANKSYLGNLTDVLNAAKDPVGNGNFMAIVQRQATSYVPKVLSQFTKLTDDGFIKRSYTLLDAMKKQLPGFASSLPPSRDILGNKMSYVASDLGSRALSIVNPFPFSATVKNSVVDAIAKLGHGFGNPEPKIMGKKFLDMRKYRDDAGRTAYDFYQERVGTIKLAGKTLEERLEALVLSKQYAMQSKMAESGIYESLQKDPRVDDFKFFLSKYRDAAKLETLQRYPELRAAKSSYRSTTATAKRELHALLNR